MRRLVLCSGKLAYELIEARDAAGDNTTSIVRIEQLYPFPCAALVTRLKRLTNLQTVVWAQEEPKNAGAWSFVESLIEECLDHTGLKPRRAEYAGRAAGAAPAPVNRAAPSSIVAPSTSRRRVSGVLVM